MTQERVIIVGGGLSGLSAAYELKTHGVDAVVLEARDRVGGRTNTIHNENVGGYVDVGGAYVGPTQDRVFRLAKQLGVKTYQVYEKGDLLYYRKGCIHKFTSIPRPPMGSVTAALDLNNFFREVDKCIEKVPFDEPWKSPMADKWDKMTLQEWLDKGIWTEAAMREAVNFSRINLSAEPYAISFLSFLWYIGQAGGTVMINSTEGGAQEQKFVGGSQQLSDGLMKLLGDAVCLESPVTKIVQDGDGVAVTTTDGRVFTGSHVVIAMAPSLQQRLTFDPPLPSVRSQLIQRFPMGSAVKTMLYYDKPYWRNKGYAGTMFTVDDDPELLVSMSIDDCKPDGSAPCLMGFVIADSATLASRMTKEQRCNLIAKQYAKVFGCPELAKPIYYEDKNWCSDPWSGGCYTGTLGPGALTQLGSSLRAPIGRIHLAGTETATEWTGYMDGAIQAGERAAREILHNMGKLGKDQIYKPEPPSEDNPAHDLRRGFWSSVAPTAPGLYKLLAGLGVAGGLGVLGYKGFLKPKL